MYKLNKQSAQYLFGQPEHPKGTTLPAGSMQSTLRGSILAVKLFKAFICSCHIVLLYCTYLRKGRFFVLFLSEYLKVNVYSVSVAYLLTKLIFSISPKVKLNKNLYFIPENSDFSSR